MTIVKKIKLDEDVKAVLRQSTYQHGNQLALRPNLESALYAKVNKALKALGGTWVKSLRVHTFPVPDIKALIAAALEDGSVVNQKQTFQFFETPMDLADRMAEMASLKQTNTVLEPSAGTGNLIRAALAYTPECIVSAVEINPAHRNDLQSTGATWVAIADFLKITPSQSFDRIIANPPFNAGQDIEHVTQMLRWLKPGGRLVTVMSMAVETSEQRPYREFRELLKTHRFEIEELPAGTFAESGTDVPAKLVVIEVSNWQSAC